MVRSKKGAETARRRDAKKNAAVDTRDWLDRNTAADIMGVSVNTIVNYESRGLLHPVRVSRADRGGAQRLHWLYDPEELSQLPRRERMSTARDPGETAARCFELFDEGKADREIVIALRITPDMVSDLRIKWDFGGGSKRVISNQAWKALADLVGEFGDVTDLVDRIAALKKAKDGEQR